MTSSTAIIHDDFSARQKAAHLTLLFANGREYTAHEVAEMFSMTVTGARQMLGRISGAIPLIADDPQLNRESNGNFSPQAGRWRRFDNE